MKALLPPLLALLALLAALLPCGTAAAADRRRSDPAPPTRREVMERTVEILNRPEFAGSGEDEEGLLLVLSNMLSDLVDGAKRLRTTNPFLYATVVGWLVATLLAIVGHVAWTVWRSGGSRAGAGRRGRRQDTPHPTPARPDPGRLLAPAAREAAAGRHAEGVPWLYLALLFRLEREGLLEFDAARTGLEYADLLARLPAARALWLSFLDVHDPVVFGTGDCGAAAFGDLRSRALAPLPRSGP